MQGMKIIIQDGVDHRKAAVVGLSFWIGTGFQNGWIFADQLGEGFLGALLGNGMTSGAIVAIIMMVFIELTGPRRRRLQTSMDMDALPKLTEFLQGFASRARWSPESAERLVLVGEETLLSMSAEENGLEAHRTRRLVVTLATVSAGPSWSLSRHTRATIWRTRWHTWGRRRR